MKTISEKDADEMVSAAAEEISNYINFLRHEESREIAQRIFDVWDEAYQAFDTYEEYITDHIESCDHCVCDEGC